MIGATVNAQSLVEEGLEITQEQKTFQRRTVETNVKEMLSLLKIVTPKTVQVKMCR